MTSPPDPSDLEAAGGDPAPTSADGRAVEAEPEVPTGGVAAAAGAPGEEPAGSASAKRAKPTLTRSIVEWVVVIAAALLIAFGIKTFLFQPFKIPSGSMENTLKIGDRVLVNKLSYHFHSVHRGDVVVFRTPPQLPGSPPIDASDLIKRVIGLPGDHVTIKNDHVYINGKELTEPYVKRVPGTNQPEPTSTSPGAGCTFPDFAGVNHPAGLPADTLVVPKGDVFVMGDNRTNSEDGRCFGPISEKLIVGRAFLRMWPLGRIGLL